MNCCKGGGLLSGGGLACLIFAGSQGAATIIGAANNNPGVVSAVGQNYPATAVPIANSGDLLLLGIAAVVLYFILK